jgi:hypothetical protein
MPANQEDPTWENFVSATGSAGLPAARLPEIFNIRVAGNAVLWMLSADS